MENIFPLQGFSLNYFQRWLRSVKGPYASVDAKTKLNCHSKLMDTVSIEENTRSGCSLTFRMEENVRVVQEMFTWNPQKSQRQASRECFEKKDTRELFWKKRWIFIHGNHITVKTYHLKTEIIGWSMGRRYMLGMKTVSIFSVISYGQIKTCYMLKYFLTVIVIIGQKRIRIWLLKKTTWPKGYSVVRHDFHESSGFVGYSGHNECRTISWYAWRLCSRYPHGTITTS